MKNKIKAFLAKFFGYAKTTCVVVNKDFTNLVGAEAAANFKSEVESVLKSALGVITLGVVSGINAVAPNLSDPAKREEAFQHILALAKAQGITVGNSLIHLFIELAVTKLNAKV